MAVEKLKMTMDKKQEKQPFEDVYPYKKHDDFCCHVSLLEGIVKNPVFLRNRSDGFNIPDSERTRKRVLRVWIRK